MQRHQERIDVLHGVSSVSVNACSRVELAAAMPDVDDDGVVAYRAITDRPHKMCSSGLHPILHSTDYCKECKAFEHGTMFCPHCGALGRECGERR